MVRRRVKVGHDRHGQYIRYRGQKIYLSQAIIKKGAKSGMDNLDLIKWIMKQLALRRRRRRRRARKHRSDLRSQKDYKNYAESKGFTGPSGQTRSTGPKLPLSMTHLPTVLYERQRLLDRAKEQKMLEESKTKETEPDRRELKRLTHLVDTGQIKQEGGQWVNTKSGRRLYLEPEIIDYLEDYKNVSDDIVKGSKSQLAETKKQELKTTQNKIKKLIEDGMRFVPDKDNPETGKWMKLWTSDNKDNLIPQLHAIGFKAPETGGAAAAAKMLMKEKTRLESIQNPTPEESARLERLLKLRFFRRLRLLETKKEALEKDLGIQPGQTESKRSDKKSSETDTSTSTPKPKNATVRTDYTVEEVMSDDDDTQESDDTHLGQSGPEKKKTEISPEEIEELPAKETQTQEQDQPPGVASTGDGSRNSKKVMKSSPPLDEHKINELMADIPGYLGTITKDEIPKLTKAAKKAWLAGMPFGWIHLTISRAQAVGNNERPGEVGHWVAVAVVPGRGAVMYYDSFGRPAPADVKTMLKAMFDKVAPREFLKFKENLIQEQSVNTNNCGWFSIKFLLDIFGGMEFTDTTPWNRSVQAERDIEKFKKKFKPFSWL